MLFIIIFLILFIFFLIAIIYLIKFTNLFWDSPEQQLNYPKNNLNELNQLNLDEKLANNIYYMFGNFKYVIGFKTNYVLKLRDEKDLKEYIKDDKFLKQYLNFEEENRDHLSYHLEDKEYLLIDGQKYYILNSDIIIAPDLFLIKIFEKSKFTEDKYKKIYHCFPFKVRREVSSIEKKLRHMASFVLLNRAMKKELFTIPNQIIRNEDQTKNIFQTFSTNVLNRSYTNAAFSWINNNPNYNYYYFNDYDMKKYIENNWNDRVIKAFNKIKPHAYKCDLWRLCILYDKGGIYADIKTGSVKSLDEFLYNIDLMLIIDPSCSKAIFNGIISAKKNHPFLLKCIDQICKNIEEENYGENELDVTGPLTIGKIYQLDKSPAKILKFEGFSSLRNILYKGEVIFYARYDSELAEKNPHKKHNGNEHYSTLYKQKKIFNNII